SPDLGLLAAQLTESVQEELSGRLASDGFRGLSSRHFVVLAYLDEDGVRATELARLAARHKQVVGRLVDEREEGGYVKGRPDPTDRRAKLVVPTTRGLELIRRADAIVAEIEARHAEEAGARTYAQFRDILRLVVLSSKRDRGPAASGLET